MLDILNANYTPSIMDIGEFINNELFHDICSNLEQEYQANIKIEYSKCSWNPGWNVKFKKAGKSLCVVYPKENYFQILVVVGKDEKEKVEEVLPRLCGQTQEIYNQTEEGNGQRWLMFNLEDKGELFDDVLQLIKIRRG